MSTHDLTPRLMGCFRTVFPDLREEEVLGAVQESIAAWDSIAAIKLVTVVEEEFGVEVDLNRMGDLNSFVRFREYLEQMPSA